MVASSTKIGNVGERTDNKGSMQVEKRGPFCTISISDAFRYSRGDMNLTVGFVNLKFGYIIQEFIRGHKAFKAMGMDRIN